MKGESSTPAAHHLFDIAEDTTKLSQNDTDIFHHFIEHILYLSKRSHPKIQLAVSFLCNIVKESENEDYKNMERDMKYIKLTIGIKLIL